MPDHHRTSHQHPGARPFRLCRHRDYYLIPETLRHALTYFNVERYRHCNLVAEPLVAPATAARDRIRSQTREFLNTAFDYAHHSRSPNLDLCTTYLAVLIFFNAVNHAFGDDILCISARLRRIGDAADCRSRIQAPENTHETRQENMTGHALLRMRPTGFHGSGKGRT